MFNPRLTLSQEKDVLHRLAGALPDLLYARARDTVPDHHAGLMTPRLGPASSRAQGAGRIGHAGLRAIVRQQQTQNMERK